MSRRDKLITVKAVLICLFALLTGSRVAGQQNTEVILMDFVKIKEGRIKEALYFYENNWKVYRDLALKKKVIKSYEIVRAEPDSLNNFDLILITTYKDSVQFAKSEENFRPILAALRPNGPALLNGLRPDDFRINVFFKKTRTLFASPKKKSG